MPSGLDGSGRNKKSVKRKRASPKVCRSRKATKPMPSESIDSSIQPKTSVTKAAAKSRQKVGVRPKLPEIPSACVVPSPKPAKKQPEFPPMNEVFSEESDEEYSEDSGSSHSPDSELDNEIMASYAMSHPDPVRLSTLVEGINGTIDDLVLSSLEEFNDLLNMSSDELVYMLPLERVFPPLFAFLRPSASLPRALLASRILSLLLDSAPPVHILKYVSLTVVADVCHHIASVVLLDLSDQCVTILSRMSRISSLRPLLEEANAVPIVLESISFFCLATQHHCLDIALDLNCAVSLDLFIDLLVHSDARMVAKAVQALGASPGVAPLSAAVRVVPFLWKITQCQGLVDALSNWARQDPTIVAWLQTLESGISEFALFACGQSRELCRSVLHLLVLLLPNLTVASISAPVDTATRISPLHASFVVAFRRFPAMTLPYALHFMCCGGDVVPNLLSRVLKNRNKLSDPIVFGALSQMLHHGTGMHSGVSELAERKGKRCWDKLVREMAVKVLKNMKKTDSHSNDDLTLLEDELLADDACYTTLNSEFVARLSRPVRVQIGKANGVPALVMVEPLATIESLREFGSSLLVENARETPPQDGEEWGNYWDDEPSPYDLARAEHDLDEEIWDSIGGLGDQSPGDRDPHQVEEQFALFNRIKKERMAAKKEPKKKEIFISFEGKKLEPSATLLEVVSKNGLHSNLITVKTKAPSVRGPVRFWDMDERKIPLLETVWGKTHELIISEEDAGSVSGEEVAVGSDLVETLLNRLAHSDCVSERLSQAVTEMFTLPVFLATRQFPDWVDLVAKRCPSLLDVAARRDLMAGKWFGTFRALGARLGASEKSLLPMVRQKVKLTRTKAVESAVVLMNTYAHYTDAILEMEFHGEEGTGSGPTNEFYAIVGETLRSDSTVFRTCADGFLFPALVDLTDTDFARHKNQGTRAPSVLAKWRLLGHFVARALLDGRLISLELSPLFWDIVKGREGLSSLEAVDPALAKSLEAIRGMTEQERGEMDLTVMPGCESIRFPKTDRVDLFIELVRETTFRVDLQVRAFKEAFAEVLPLAVLGIWTGSELAELLSGSSKAEHWERKHLEEHIQTAHGYTKKSPAFEWFITIIEGMDEKQKIDFIKFVTGSRSLPFGGFAGLKPLLTVVRVGEGGDAILPSVMTCANFVKLPDYSSAVIMKAQLLRAISEGQGSFLLS